MCLAIACKVIAHLVKSTELFLGGSFGRCVLDAAWGTGLFEYLYTILNIYANGVLPPAVRNRNLLPPHMRLKRRPRSNHRIVRVSMSLPHSGPPTRRTRSDLLLPSAVPA